MGFVAPVRQPSLTHTLHEGDLLLVCRRIAQPCSKDLQTQEVNQSNDSRFPKNVTGHRARDTNTPLWAAFKKRKTTPHRSVSLRPPIHLHGRSAGQPTGRGCQKAQRGGTGSTKTAAFFGKGVKGWGGPSGTGNTQSVLSEYSQEAESATQLAPFPTTLIPCFPGYATVNHHHPHLNLGFSKSLLRAF